MHLSLTSVPCPGLFYRTSARDGIISRIRVPGGIITTGQFRAIADLADNFGTGYVNITNRANLQIREIRTEITADVLHTLQEIGLASAIPEVDHLRNIMGSPTAGIDSEELIDTRSLIRKLDNYITTHPELAPLSPKFSIAVDGGGAVKVCDRRNDIVLNAVEVNTQIYFHLKLNLGKSVSEPLVDTDILLQPQECVEVVAAIAKVYLHHSAINSTEVTPPRKSRKVRLFEVLQHLGLEKFLQELKHSLPQFPHSSHSPHSPHSSHSHLTRYLHLGVHPQRQEGLSYIGVVLPLGKLETWQMRGLADIAQAYGSRTLRLTPWQNLLLADIPNQYIHETKSKIKNLSLHWNATHIHSALVACAGIVGCASSATDTKDHALKLAEYLDKHITLDYPVNIHFTGCQKSCAQHSNSDITFLGVDIEAYRVYVGDDNNESKFGQELYQHVPFAELLPLLEKMLQVYIAKRATRHESFGEFANRHNIADLQRMFNGGIGEGRGPLWGTHRPPRPRGSGD